MLYELVVGLYPDLLQLESLCSYVIDPVADHFQVPSDYTVLDDIHWVLNAYPLRDLAGLLGRGEEACEEPVDGVCLVLPGDCVLGELHVAVHKAVQGLLEHDGGYDVEAAHHGLKGEVVGVDGALEEEVAV